ncbi:MAG: hypothetical protein IT480_01550 [Gammaproteobacteria bacterium]|nr:hypothetical protein [Gammaproteobacteria bacterium]
MRSSSVLNHSLELGEGSVAAQARGSDEGPQRHCVALGSRLLHRHGGGLQIGWGDMKCKATWQQRLGRRITHRPLAGWRQLGAVVVESQWANWLPARFRVIYVPHDASLPVLGPLLLSEAQGGRSGFDLND